MKRTFYIFGLIQLILAYGDNVFAQSNDVPSGIISRTCAADSLEITVNGTLTDAATLTLGAATGITGAIAGDTFTYDGTIDCDLPFSIVDGATTYSFE